MAIIGLDGDLLGRLIKDAFPGRVEQLLDRWHAREDRLGDGSGSVPDRSTVYRWINKGSLPRGRHDFLTICSLLDIDPLSLLVAANSDTSRALDYLLSSLQSDRWHQPALSFLSSLMGLQHGWPPDDFVKQYYDRPWHTFEIEHDPTIAANYYALINIRGSAVKHERSPQIFHFAYRLPMTFRQRWLEYGIVLRFGDGVRLFQINGHRDQYSGASEANYVETWFGPGPALFRIASLHLFTAELADGEVADGTPRVRFPG